MIKITCTSCQKPLSLDETKLPTDRAVLVPCPLCQTKLTVDRRKLAGAGAAPVAASGLDDTPGGGYDADDDDGGVGAKALIVGNDHPALRQAAKLVGFVPVHVETAAAAREFYMQEFPPVVILNPPQMSPPPLESMQPIVGLTSSDRRKGFFILVADNLRTLDGNAAFLYGVNLIVAPKDLGQFPQIFRDAHGYHERLYAAVNSVLKSMQA